MSADARVVESARKLREVWNGPIFVAEDEFNDRYEQIRAKLERDIRGALEPDVEWRLSYVIVDERTLDFYATFMCGRSDHEFYATSMCGKSDHEIVILRAYVGPAPDAEPAEPAAEDDDASGRPDWARSLSL